MKIRIQRPFLVVISVNVKFITEFYSASSSNHTVRYFIILLINFCSFFR